MQAARPLFAALCALLLPFGCVRPPAPGEDGARQGDEAPAGDAIVAHTSGTVSNESRIRVAFSRDVVESLGAVDPSPIEFDPPLEGTARWARTDELEFEPDEPLPRGQRYQAEVDLAALGFEDEGSFSFSFTVLKQGAALSLDGVETGTGDEREEAVLRGRISTDDVAEGAAVEEGLMVESPYGDPEVTWTHEENRKDHRFVVEGLPRREDDYSVTVRFDASTVNAGGTRQLAQRIPGLNTFTVLQARAVQKGDRHLELRFSDPLEASQDLAGLVSVEGRDDLRFVRRGNVLEVYGAGRLPDAVTVRVAPGIENVHGYKLKKGAEYEIRFERLKPEVRFVGKGTVVPSTEGLTVPLETANLRRVTIEALRVPGENLPQFFQVNRYDGDNELKRVGRVVWRRKVDLGDERNLKGAWSRHGLDLSPLVAKEPAGMVRLRVTFDRSDILYECAPGEGVEPVPAPVSLGEDDALGNWDDEAESSNWDSWEGNYWEAYENRNDPCHPGYYRQYHDHDVAQTKNVLLSDLGLMAKRGTSGELLVVVTNLKTTAPVAGAEVRVLDYQQAVLAEGRTDGAGKLSVQPERSPFLAVAEAQGQSGYLRLDEGGALSTAHFDTGGAAVFRGLKGFFYGERGVWRPGDDIFLTFLLSDKDRPLPGSHPVHFTLTDPRGKVVARTVRKESNDGFYIFKLKTGDDAPTGNYTAKVKVGGATFSHVLKVEAIVPNRLKIGLEAEGEILKPGEPLDAELSAQWLHGALAKNLKAEVEAQLLPSKTTFSQFSEYKFDAPTRRYDAERRTIFEGRLDGKGEAEIDETLPFDGEAAGMLRAAFTTKVYEPSGAFSVERQRLSYSPYERYVGVRLPPGDKARGMLLTDTEHTVRLVAVDERGEAVDEPVKVDVKLYKINWRWWWEKGEEKLTDYAGQKSFTPLAEETVTLTEGAGTWSFEIKYPDWGRYLVVATDEEGGHQTGWIFYCDWPGWAGRAQADQPGGATVLTLTTDEEEYAVGDEVTLSIPASVTGRALVSLESGSRVLQADWVEADGEALQYKFRATADMAPNVYAHVTLLQPHLKSKNDLPLRLYGITPVRVVDPTTRLQPVLDVPESFEPGKTATVKVAEQAGRPMTYTLALVDEGLLGLTRYRTPNPWQHFYAREALGVKTWDLFDEVAGAFGGKLESLLAIGGDGAGGDGGRPRANRFPPMVIFDGPFSLDAGETKTHRMKLPPYVGAVRAMVVAGHDDAYGAAGEEVFVRKPLIVLGTLPRVVGPGEEVALPAAVFALEDEVRDVEVSVEGNELVEVVGAAAKELTFPEPGDQIVPFQLRVKEKLGIARVTVTAEGGGERATYEVELDVRHPGSTVVDVEAARIEPGQSWSEATLSLPGMVGTNEVTVELSRVPPLDLERRLGMLIRYPHGCVEQITSAAFPQIFLDELVSLEPARAADVEKHVKAAIEKLRGFQHKGGGFAYWPSDQRSHDWSSSWVGHFLLEAKKAGYQVPSDMVRSWKRYQQQTARAWRSSHDDAHAHAYRLYTLALAGTPEIGAMNRLKEHPGLNDRARWQLAAAYQLAGQRTVARGLVDDVAPNAEEREVPGPTFGSQLRDRAMILTTLVELDDDRATDVAKAVAEELSSDRGLSTQSAAFGLLAMARWARQAPGSDTIDAVLRYGDRTPVKAFSNKPLDQVALALSDEEEAAPGRLEVKNEGEGVVFLRLIKAGVPAVGKEEVAEQGLKVEVAYLNAEGKALGIGSVEQGTDVRMQVTVKNTTAGRKLDELALTHIVPSGFEIRNERLDLGAVRSGKLDYQDVRDDRVLTYFDLKPGEARTFEIETHATYLGRYYLPPIQAEAMYEPALQGRTAGRWIEVVEAPPPGER